MTLQPVPRFAPRSMVAPRTSPAFSPMVTHGAITTPSATSTSPSMTTWPWTT